MTEKILALFAPVRMLCYSLLQGLTLAQEDVSGELWKQALAQIDYGIRLAQKITAELTSIRAGLIKHMESQGQSPIQSQIDEIKELFG